MGVARVCAFHLQDVQARMLREPRPNWLPLLADRRTRHLLRCLFAQCVHYVWFYHVQFPSRKYV